MLLLQAPEPDKSELSAEELQTVELFLQNTPSVVNIANIGEMPMHQLQGLKSSAAPSLLTLNLDAILGSRLGCFRAILSCAASTTARSTDGQSLEDHSPAMVSS